MATFRRFEDIEAWQKARALTQEIYRISNLVGFAKDFGLRDQIRRASVSIMSNNSEGFERGGSREFAQFLAVAKGSTGEVKSQPYVAFDQQYISELEFQRMFSRADETARMINGLMQYLRATKIRGSKYRGSRTT